MRELADETNPWPSQRYIARPLYCAEAFPDCSVDYGCREKPGVGVCHEFRWVEPRDQTGSCWPIDMPTNDEARIRLRYPPMRLITLFRPIVLAHTMRLKTLRFPNNRRKHLCLHRPCLFKNEQCGDFGRYKYRLPAASPVIQNHRRAIC